MARKPLTEDQRVAKKARDAGYRKRDRELLNRRARDYYSEHKDRINEARKNKHVDKEKNLARYAVYREANRKTINENKRARRAADLNKALADEARYRKKHAKALADYQRKTKHLMQVRVRNRRARLLGNGGKHTACDIAFLLKTQKGKCVYCRRDISKKYEVDHVLALAVGGSSDRTNLQLLCRSCNASKGAKHPIAFAQSIGLLL